MPFFCTVVSVVVIGMIEGGGGEVQRQSAAAVFLAAGIIVAPDVRAGIAFLVGGDDVHAVAAVLALEAGRLPDDVKEGRKREIRDRIDGVAEALDHALALEAVDQRGAEGDGVEDVVRGFDPRIGGELLGDHAAERVAGEDDVRASGDGRVDDRTGVFIVVVVELEAGEEVRPPVGGLTLGVNVGAGEADDIAVNRGGLPVEPAPGVVGELRLRDGDRAVRLIVFRLRRGDSNARGESLVRILILFL